MRMWSFLLQEEGKLAERNHSARTKAEVLANMNFPLHHTRKGTSRLGLSQWVGVSSPSRNLLKSWPCSQSVCVMDMSLSNLAAALSLKAVNLPIVGKNVSAISFFFFLILTQGHAYWFQRGEGRERGRGREHWCKGGTSICCLSYAPRLGTKPTTKVCALTGNGTCDISVYGLTLQPTEAHWPGILFPHWQGSGFELEQQQTQYLQWEPWHVPAPPTSRPAAAQKAHTGQNIFFIPKVVIK